MKKLRALPWKICAAVHLAIFSGASIWFLVPGSLARIIDQLDEAMEFIFSTVPVRNYYLLVDGVAQAAAVRLILLFVCTAVPVYAIGYLLYPRVFLKHRHLL